MTVFPAVAEDLFRDRDKIALQISKARSAMLGDLCIIAPRYGGRLNGSTFLGLPVFEGDVFACIVGIV